jgi:oligoendopeptidase F
VSNLRALSAFAERRFVPREARLTEKTELESLYQRLLDRGVTSMGELEQWITDLSELDAAVSQAASILYIEMTCRPTIPLDPGPIRILLNTSSRS